MDIGSLRHRITILRSEMTVNAAGFEEELWSPVTTLWASVRHLQGKEFYEAAALQQEQTLLLTIRYRADIGLDDQILFRDDTYNISSIDNSQYRDRVLILRASKVKEKEEHVDGHSGD